MRLKHVDRFILQLLIFLLQSGLFAWAMLLPIIWIVRDGLDPDSRETGWAMGICKTLADLLVVGAVLPEGSPHREPSGPVLWSLISSDDHIPGPESSPPSGP
jgi:hypothetical protein